VLAQCLHLMTLWAVDWNGKVNFVMDERSAGKQLPLQECFREHR